MNSVLERPHPQQKLTALSLLGRSAEASDPYEAEVIGEIPSNLRGTLFRNGPGLFERDGIRKKHLLDGDGFIQSLRIADQKATYQSRFVQTKKFVAEQKAKKFLTPTWSTLAPKTISRNLGARLLPQAGVTVVKRGERLIAFDDIGMPYELDWRTLETRRDLAGDVNFPLPSYNAHSFIDTQTKQWIQFGLSYGRVNQLHLSISKADGSRGQVYRYPINFATYFHDFFVTQKYVVFLMHPLRFNPLKMLLGMSSFIDSFKWQAELGNQLWIISRESGELISKVDTTAAFMWHSLNAYDRGNEIVADFVGYDEPDHFIGPDAEFNTIMKGRAGNAKYPGTVRRYVIQPRAQKISATTIADGYHEFPMINPRYYCQAHRYGYFTKGFESDTNLHNGIVRIDLESGASDEYCYGKRFHVGEPVFIANKGHATKEQQGWLISQILDAEKAKSGFAVFDAESISDGPIAEIMMRTHSPLSFHGWWTSAV